MCGALGQFIPVLTERPLHSNRLPLPALAVLVTGLAALILGFLRLDGRVSTELPFLSVAALLLGAGFSLVIYNLARTLWSARPLALPARFMATGLAAVGVAATLGMIFAFVLDQAMTGSVFVRIHSGALPIHIIAGLGGWLGGELVERLGVGVHEGANLDAPSSLSHASARSTTGARM